MINLEILFIVDSRETLNACFNVVRCLTQILNTIYSTCIVTNSGIFIYRTCSLFLGSVLFL